jgi:hypothetical protein
MRSGVALMMISVVILFTIVQFVFDETKVERCLRATINNCKEMGGLLH